MLMTVFTGNLFLGWEEAVSRDDQTHDRTDHCNCVHHSMIDFVSFRCGSNNRSTSFSLPVFFPFFLAFIDYPPSVNLIYV